MATGLVTCASCGAAAAQAARFCASCGAALGAPAPVGEERKTVTAVFADVTGSTALVRRLDPEAMRALMEQYFAAVSTVLVRHGGTVEKFVGDAVMAAFGVPVAHEDDALRACRAAVEILAAVDEVGQRAEAAHGVRFGVRVGVETGEVVVGNVSRGSTFASGAPVNTAARLEQAAEPGECLIGPGCLRLVRDVVVVEERAGLTLQGIDGMVVAHRLLAIREGDAGQSPATPMVGRSRELALLRRSFDRAVSDRTCQLTTILGPAGIGKSRLAHEFLSAVEQEATVLRGRCVSYGEGVTYWPLVQAVRQMAGLTGAEPEQVARSALAGLLVGVPDAAEVVDRVAPVAGLGGAPGSPEDTAWAVQRLLEALAAHRPVVLVVDDLHWAEPGMVAVLERLCDWSRAAPILVAVIARPELLDDHPGWGAGRSNAVTALLEPLRDDEVDVLTSGVVGGELPAEAANRIREAAGGNPLFVEQLLAMLLEDGTLAREGSGWVLRGDVSSVRIPPTITALLEARLDRLSAPERALLASAAVIGQVFYRAAVTELSTLPADQVAVQLRALVRKGLVGPATADLPGQESFRFGHVLIRDAAYATMPKAVRADLHERFARWLEKHFEGQSYNDFIGGHLESAYQFRAELGTLDEAARGIGREAAERLEAAGRLLLFADDGAAIALLERADALRSDDGPDRWALQIELASAWSRNASRLEDAVRTADAVRLGAEAAGDLQWAGRASIWASLLRLVAEPGSAMGVLRRDSLAAVEVFTAAEDHYGLSVAHQALFVVANISADTVGQLRHVVLAAEHADLAGRHREAQLYRQATLLPLILGDCPAERGLEESRRQFEQAEHRTGRALTAACISFFATLLGEQEEAAQAWELAEAVASELGRWVMEWITWVASLATIHVGDWPAAARLCAEVCRNSEATGDRGALATDAAMHAHALLHIGAPELARQQVESSEQIGADNDVLTQGFLHGARAWLAALDGDQATSRRHITVASGALPADQLPARALIQETCAEAAALFSDDIAARAHRQRAIDLYGAKGNVVSVARLAELL
jgi:class 3 adenylate cyclase